ncbi:MAG: TetR/AcrR family transcriptional regulator [Chloroflexi bacterium CFX7]|nr:MAG: TetR/AcrR family transcriptional regulator [bacterium]MCE7929419.1 TetR/AcrR family transcriptional regulator [Chloroflexi bacterium CFX7]
MSIHFNDYSFTRRSPPLTRVTQAHIDARVESIRSAARSVFARRGIEAATMSEIAAEAGLSTGAIYRYFQGKDDLVAATFAEGQERTRRAFEQARANSGSMLEAMLEAGRLALVELRDRETVCLDLECALSSARTGGVVREETRAFREYAIGLVEGFVFAAQQAGEIPAGLDPRGLSVLLNALVLGLGIIDLEMGDEFDAEVMLGLFSRIVLAAGAGAH